MEEKDDTSRCRKFIDVVSIDEEDDDGGPNTCRELPVEVGYLLQTYLPNILSSNNLVSPRPPQALRRDISLTFVPQRSPSLISAPQVSETWSVDSSRPPPTMVAISTSSTDDDEETAKPKTESDKGRVKVKRSQADPFAPRIGKTLCWRNVNMTLVR
jgi:hypothetical protein